MRTARYRRRQYERKKSHQRPYEIAHLRRLKRSEIFRHRRPWPDRCSPCCRTIAVSCLADCRPACSLETARHHRPGGIALSCKLRSSSNERRTGRRNPAAESPVSAGWSEFVAIAGPVDHGRLEIALHRRPGEMTSIHRSYLGESQEKLP